MLFRSIHVCTILRSVCDLGSGLSVNSSLESLICWLGLDSYMQSPRINPINTFMLLSWISLPSAFCFPEASLFSPLAQSWRFSYPFCHAFPWIWLHSGPPQGVNAERITPPSWDQSSSDPQRRFLSEFWFLPPAASASVTKAKRLLRSWDEREWALGVPVPTPWAHTRGLFLGSTLSLWALVLGSGF